MNQTDRDRMARLYEAVAAWPFPNRNRTIGIGDLSEFFSNMESLQRPLLRAVMAISRTDDPSQDPDGELDHLFHILRTADAPLAPEEKAPHVD